MREIPPRATAAVLLALLLSGSVLPAQDGLDLDVWRFLRAEGRAVAAAARKSLRARDDLTLKRVLAVLDAPPPLEGGPVGRVRAVPWTIPGTRVRTTYELYVPPGVPAGRKLPLWIAMHGTGGTGEGVMRMLGLLRQAGEPVILAAPTEAADLHGKGWGSKPRERSLHTGLIDELARRYPVDRDRVILMGWSRGGHGSFDVGVRFPDRFAGIGPIIGAVPYRDLPLIDNLAGMKVMVVNGGRDQPALVEAVQRAVRRMRQKNMEPRFILDPARGHEPFMDRLPEMVRFLLGARREVAPRRLSLTAWDRDYVRNRYVVLRKLSSKVYRPGRPIKAKGASGMSAKERRELIARHVDRNSARLKVVVDGNEFRIETTLVKRFDLYLPLSLLDFEQPVDVWVNGKRFKKNLRVKRPTGLRLLELMREFGGADPAFRFARRLSFSVR